MVYDNCTIICIQKIPAVYAVQLLSLRWSSVVTMTMRKNICKSGL